MHQKFIVGLCVMFMLVWVAGCNRSNESVVKPTRNTSAAETPAAEGKAPAANNRSAANRGTSRRSAANNSRGQKSGSQKNSGSSASNKPPTRDDIANNEDLPDQVRERFDKNKKGGRDRSK